MGVRGLLSLLREEDVPHTTIYDFSSNTVHLDVLGTYFALIRALFVSALSAEAAKEAKRIHSSSTSATSTASPGVDPINLIITDNIQFGYPTTQPTPSPSHQNSQRPFLYAAFYEKVAKIIDKKLVKLNLSQQSTTLHFDGLPSAEKQNEHKARNDKRLKNLEDLEKDTTKFRNGAKGGYSILLRRAKNNTTIPQRVLYQIQQEFITLGWNVCTCAYESDVCIASKCSPQDHVISGDSDLLIYRSVNFLVIPTGKQKQLELYKKSDVTNTLSISSYQLMLLGILTRNDYNNPIPGMGIRKNLDHIRATSFQPGMTTSTNIKADVDRDVSSYQMLHRPNKSSTQPSTFQKAIDVFVEMKQNPQLSIQASTSTSQTSRSNKPVWDYFLKIELASLERQTRAQQRAQQARQSQSDVSIVAEIINIIVIPKIITNIQFTIDIVKQDTSLQELTHRQSPIKSTTLAILLKLSKTIHLPVRSLMIILQHLVQTLFQNQRK